MPSTVMTTTEQAEIIAPTAIAQMSTSGKSKDENDLVPRTSGSSHSSERQKIRNVIKTQGGT